MKPFWIVTKDACNLTANKRHESVEEAKKEAERLAKIEQKLFYVFYCIGGVKPSAPPVEWERIENENELPF